MKPAINITEDTPEKLRFTLSNSDVSIANSLRRVLISEIPTVGIVTDTHENNKCDITKNTSRFHNEILKHRLSCIPIHIDDPLKFKLDKYKIVVNKQNNTDKDMYVTSEDFEIVDVDTKLPINKQVRDTIFPKNNITNYFIDFCKLRPKLADNLEGEQIQFTASMEIVKGTKTFNTSYIATYGNTIDPKLAATHWKKKEQELKLSLSSEEIANEKKNWYLLEAKRHFIPNSFDFTVGTVGVYENRQLIKLACDVLLQKMDNLKSIIENQELEVRPSLNTIHNCYDVIIMNEDYTVGNLLAYMVNAVYQSKEVTFNGVYKAHPHDNFIKLKIALISEHKEDFIYTCLLTSIKHIIGIYSEIKNQFS